MHGQPRRQDIATRRQIPGRGRAVHRAALILAVLAAALTTASAQAETRLALVIGNSSYAKTPLANPRNDAALIATALEGAGFDVTRLIDADQALMKRAILDFGRRLRSADSVGLFYYAGHGVQIDGENYLIPVGADIAALEEVALNGVALGELLKTMERAGSRLNIAILDACRDNPFAGTSRSVARGLAPVTAPSGTLIAYATAPGQVALDGTGSNSPYTAALAEAIPSEGVPIEDVFRRTRRKVLEVTSNRQTPWEHSSLTGEFFFRPKSALPEASARDDTTSQPAGDARLAEIAAWEKIRASKDPEALRQFLGSYPEGLFSELASLRLVNLETYAAPWTQITTGSISASTEPAKAETLYEEAVKLDSPTATASDVEKSAFLFREAAKLGLPAAMFSLARAYDKGRGVARDAGEAADWYKEAAAKDHVPAMASLGTLYEFGEGVPVDLAEALRLYLQAANAGDVNAMTSLGFLYAEGKGVARHPGEARKWYAKAAAGGQSRAMFNLALMHIRGEGGRANFAEAVRLLRTAADKGHAGALRELAALHDEGRGVSRDPVKAAELLLQAFKSGSEQARRDILERPDAWSFSTRRQVQRKLAQRGYYTGTAHGYFDPRTRSALERFAKG